MDEGLKLTSKLNISDEISSKLDKLYAIVSSLVALGLSAASNDSLPFIPDDKRTEQTFLALGEMATQLHEEIKLHNAELLNLK